MRVEFCSPDREEDLKPIDGNSFFFHTAPFINSRKEKTISFSLVEKDNVLIRIFFNDDQNSAVSLKKCSFGSFDISHRVKKEQLLFFAENMLQSLGDLGFRCAYITNFPECYNDIQANIIHHVLNDVGFTTSQKIDNQYFVVNDKNFFDLVNQDERRYLNHATRLGLKFRKLSIGHLPDIYKLIEACRLSKGYPITMTYQEVEKTILQFPDNYLIFGVYFGDRLIASSICIRVNGNILYDFYHGDDLDFRKYSPVVPLIGGLYSYAKENNFTLLDLGTSTEDGIYNFKKNLGAIDTVKLTYEKEL